jgi:hypothetical protein
MSTVMRDRPLITVLAFWGTAVFCLSVAFAYFFTRWRAQTLRIAAALIGGLCLTGLVCEIGLALDYRREIIHGSVLLYVVFGNGAFWVAVQGRLPRWGWRTEMIADAFTPEEPDSPPSAQERQGK